MLPHKIHYHIFLLGTVMLVVGLPLSPFLLSVSIMLLSLNYVVETISFSGDWSLFHEKWAILKSRKSILLMVSIYIVHVIWLFNTIDFNYALRDLKIKLPFLALPIIYGTLPPLSKKHFNGIIQIFVGSVLVSTLITTYVLLGYSWLDQVDFRSASLFISHIRFSLLVVLSIHALFYMTFLSNNSMPGYQKTGYILLMIWFVCFLVLLQSFTGIVIFLLLLPVLVFWYSYKTGSKKWIISSYIFVILLICGVTGYTTLCFKRFHIIHDSGNLALDKTTINGNSYIHHPETEEYENGYKIWINISERELQKGWNERSTFTYIGLDRKGQSIRSTLIRYMTR